MRQYNRAGSTPYLVYHIEGHWEEPRYSRHIAVEEVGSSRKVAEEEEVVDTRSLLVAEGRSLAVVCEGH